MQLKLPILLLIIAVVATLAFYAGKSSTGDIQVTQGNGSNPAGAEPVAAQTLKESVLAAKSSGDDPIVNSDMEMPESDYQALWASYSEPDRQLISEFDARYFSALQFYSPAQYEWMKNRGYPTPDDILIAEQLSLEELKDLADKGIVVAMNLVADRALNELVRLRDAYGDAGIDPYESPEFFANFTIAGRYAEMAARAGSPFSGYLKAREKYELGGINSPSEDAFADAVNLSFLGLAFAASMGDRYAANRARWLASSAGVGVERFNDYSLYAGFFRAMVGTNCNLPTDMMPEADTGDQ